MEYRRLGNSGLRVSAFSFGTMTFGGTGMFATMGNTDITEARQQIDLCLAAGVNLFDTADVYSAGLSEEILGKALGERRQQVLIATKFLGRTGPGVNDKGASRHHIINACEASLRRLGTDYIDLYQIHNQDLVTPPDEIARALEDLVRAGKVRYIGACNHAGWTLMRSLARADHLGFTRYVSQQIQYSLLERGAENELLPLGVQEGLGALIWGPLAGGYLTGKFRIRAPERKAPSRLEARDMLTTRDTERSRRIVDALDAIACEREVSITQVALNWIVRKPGISSVIIGARTRAQLEDNLAAASWSLSDTEIARLDDVSATPASYPYNMHHDFMPDLNPRAPLQPPISTPAGKRPA
ncbi:MAG TPA: aldo/keto reductase [Porticoccaceae bacterium]